MGDQVDLNCDDYQVKSASIAQGPNGTVFRCTIGPVTDEVADSLELAARSDATVRLVFPKQPLVLESIDVKRVESGSVLIEGKVVSS